MYTDIKGLVGVPESFGISIAEDAYELFMKVVRSVADVGRYTLGIKLSAPLDVVP